MPVTAHQGRLAPSATVEARDDGKLLERLGRAVAEGDLPANADPGTLASYGTTVLHGLSIQARDGCTREQAHAVIGGAMLGWDELVRCAEQAARGDRDV